MNGKGSNGLEPLHKAAPMLPPQPTEDLTTRGLKFLSSASTGTLSAITVGLIACTYLLLGRLGLLLIGALGGIVLHATWEGQNIENTRRENGLDVVRRVLDLRDAQASSHVLDEDDSREDDELSCCGFEGFAPETAIALNELVQSVVRDYVNWWYHPILPKEQSFPAASRKTLTNFVLSISQHLSRKRPADTFLDFLTHSSSIIIVFLNELSSALSASQGLNVSAAKAVNIYLLENPESNLANVLNETQQTKKFKMIAEDILQNFLEKSTYHCGPAKIFLKEILSGVVLEMSLKTCSRPEWINGWIVYLLEDGEPDISQAIDGGIASKTESISPFDDFEGNLGNVGLAKPSKSQAEKQKKREEKKHKKRLSKAEEAMQEAMEEAKRINQMIEEEETRKINGSIDVTHNGPMATSQENSQGLNLKSTAEKNGLDSVIDFRPNSQEPHDIPGDDRGSTTSTSNSRTASPLSPQSGASFTNFDQIIPHSIPAALQVEPSAPRRATITLTLHNANIILYDESSPADKGRLRNKPNGDYMIQIEPESSQHPGWMTMRRYSDFETLHEVLRRIAQISGITGFTEQHHTLPNWKEHTKASLRGELERYLRDACWYRLLADSEGMKRFLEKDQGHLPNQTTKSQSTFETMGKGMLDVLTSAPKGAAEGGKAVLGGVAGVFNNIGSLTQKKPSISSNSAGMHPVGRSSTSSLPRMDSINSLSSSRKGRVSEDSLRAVPLNIVHTQPAMISPMERRPSYSIAEDENEQPQASSSRSSMSGRRSTTQSRDPSRAPSRKTTPLSSPTQGSIGDLRLPPPPSDIPDDYASHDESPTTHSRTESSAPTNRTSISTAPSQQSPSRASLSKHRGPGVPTPPRKARKEPLPLSEQETRVAVELMFAVVNEIYTLSSAWNIRRTLLTAAKTFLLRPGNPSLNSIQVLIQDSVIQANTSDEGIASHLRKLRENIMPTEEELKGWPPEMSVEEKEKLRIKARKLLIERGVPAALIGVMGQAATGEALGRIFDCLQIEEVARGLMFGLLLQGVRAVTH
ncbi:hypothetical protein B7494_g2296 [Chlorociboria aeruginascens]|nr:hypothetical protein B7494_g2296 [Chlorociboria aeruginascens]